MQGMKSLLELSVAALCLLSACESPVRSTQALDVGPDVRALEADVYWLADDARDGRRAGTAGERAAGDFIAERFRELGLEPAGEDGTFFQEFEVPLPARDGGRSSLVYPGEEDMVFVHEARDLVPLFCSEGDRVTAPMVWCGYGIQNEDFAWDDYGDARLDGAIALCLRGVPPDARPVERPEAESDAVQKGSGWGNSGSLFHKVMTAKRHGAAGVVVVDHPTSGSGLAPFDPAQVGRAGIPCVMLSPRALSEVWSEFGSTVAALDATAASEPSDRLLPVPRELFGNVDLRADVVRGAAVARNVLARRPGVFPSRTVVIGAHYDHLGRGGEGSLAPTEHGVVHNGADDNASGTACVLELARIFSGDRIPDGDLVYALWSGEELGLLGSEHWMKHPTVDLARVQANLNMDMVGRAGDGVLQVLGAGTSPVFEGWMRPAGELAGLELKVNLSGQGTGGSDHQVFLRHEIPALHLFSGVHTDYHRPSDDPELVEYGGMERVVRLCVDLVTRMQAERSLAFRQVDDERKRTERERGTSAWFGSVPSYEDDPRGLLLNGTSPGGPAEAAGLLGGDVLTEVGEVAIATIHDFVYALQLYKPGDVVRVRYLRDGELEETRITLSTRQAL